MRGPKGFEHVKLLLAISIVWRLTSGLSTSALSVSKSMFSMTSVSSFVLCANVFAFKFVIGLPAMSSSLRLVNGAKMSSGRVVMRPWNDHS